MRLSGARCAVCATAIGPRAAQSNWQALGIALGGPSSMACQPTSYHVVLETTLHEQTHRNLTKSRIQLHCTLSQSTHSELHPLLVALARVYGLLCARAGRLRICQTTLCFHQLACNLQAAQIPSRRHCSSLATGVVVFYETRFL